MTQFKKTELQLAHETDPKTWRHYLNGRVTVLHCHHYACLYSQLADDCSLLDAKKLLASTSKESFLPVLADVFADHGATATKDRVTLAEQLYAAVGLGKMRVAYAGPESGEVELEHSHLDEGWMKKWGKRDEPVNFIGCGYVAALFSAVFGKPAGSYEVREVQSIVSGAEQSRFIVSAG